MGWFRANGSVVARLAFFALACQLAFSFGHIHVDKFGVVLAPQAAPQITHAEADAPAQEGRQVFLFHVRPAAAFEERAPEQGISPPDIAIPMLSWSAEDRCKMTLHNANRFDIFSLI